MFSLAYLLFAFASISETAEHELTWVFKMRACHACHERQLDIMDRFFVKGDGVIIVTDRNTEKVVLLETKINDRFEDVIVEVQNNGMLMTGFVISDLFSGESFSYRANSGTYNTSRADYLLRLFRDPKIKRVK